MVNTYTFLLYTLLVGCTYVSQKKKRKEKKKSKVRGSWRVFRFRWGENTYRDRVRERLSHERLHVQ